ncbi:hypothetical protein I3J09_00075 [Streptomyces clavuligerus]|uniref:MSP1_C domain-containing protein n=4 Tax=Streptomyces clavuligerus TaxID=1901 RepID=E2Q2Q2_STRCL|nr:hypothetical protein [Streptomyces clavuligerus]ANW16740.1 hypothetical protein BB341_00110 [Streptomyces clavuligerus]AXU11265.1 hypothetical protein D1794_00125 [Streptomyces clavuligerus]EFG10763.1 MSP1_C domain-containing protein [Streptomyces clavuligerus]MBY6301072.1 hypothetical protein [Streptomyces clavuligerus]QCS04133.1 hypothetical protein CRV15_00125 [Streptomyces clavuligerus]
MRFAPLARALVPSALCATVVIGVTGPAAAAPVPAFPPDAGAEQTDAPAATDGVPDFVAELLAQIAAAQGGAMPAGQSSPDLAGLPGALAGLDEGLIQSPLNGDDDDDDDDDDDGDDDDGDEDDALAAFRAELDRLVAQVVADAQAPSTQDLPMPQDALASALASMTGNGAAPAPAAPAAQLSPSALGSLPLLGALGQSGQPGQMGQLGPMGQLAPAAQTSPSALGSLPLLGALGQSGQPGQMGQLGQAPGAQTSPSALGSIPLLGEITQLIQAVSAGT